jgi:glutamine amidotransferase
MCRWVAYSGGPVLLEELIFKPQHSLIDQSLESFQSASTTNGDGFGVGWYGLRDFPGLFKETKPAWNDPNLRDIAAQVVSPLFMAHVRATTGTEIQRSNCHPSRYQNWLFMHNGEIRDFERIRRDLTIAVKPELYPVIRGTTDSELMFFLALTYGMDSDVVSGIERMVGYVETVARKAGIDNPIQMTLGISDGETLYAIRYSSERQSRSLFHSRSVESLREIYPEAVSLSADAIAIVSEPLSDLSGVWEEIPESSVVISGSGKREIREFSPTLAGVA